MNRLARGAAAGLLGIAAWIPAMAVDKRLTGSPYDDVTLLGTLVAPDASAKSVGLLMHAVNGAAFGVVYGLFLDKRLPGRPWLRGLIAATIECASLSTLTPLLDRWHPGVRAGRTGKTATPVAIAQAFWRHAVFGAVLGVAYSAIAEEGSK